MEYLAVADPPPIYRAFEGSRSLTGVSGEIPQFSPSEFVHRLKVDERLDRQISEIRKLGPNWNSYGAEPPNAQAFELLERIRTAAQSLSIDITRIVPSADGGVGACFVRGEQYAHIEASNDGDLWLVFRSPSGESVDREIRFDEIQEALLSIRSQLGI